MHRILIADDREMMRSALKNAFRLRPNWEICGEATDGYEVVAKAAELQPDLILLDLKMPFSNGLLAANEIRKVMPSIPIVLYTLYKNHELETAAKLAGIRSVVAKEDGFRRLLAAIDAELLSASAIPALLGIHYPESS